MFRSFTFRLALAFAGAGVLTAAVTAIMVNLAFGAEFSGYLRQQQDRQQAQMVTTLADSYRRAGGWNPADLQGATPIALMSGGSVQVLDASGRLVWNANSGAVSAGMLDMHQQMGGGGPLGLEHRLPVIVDRKTVGTAVVRLPQPGLAAADAQFHQGVNGLFVLGGLAGAVVALFVGILLARRATSPARELAEVARALAAGDRSQRVSIVGQDEFGRMGQAFNAMADAIDEEDRLRRNFAASVAHEVRTPLSILRSQVEALQDRVMRPSPHALASLHEEVMRLSRLVADLESLAFADAASFSLHKAPADLGELVRAAVAEFSGPFTAGGIRLESAIAPLHAEVDTVRLRQAVSNLLTNALKFTPEGGRARVELVSEGNQAVIRVTDTGSGIPPDELPKVFDRFFRGRDARPGGSGIGLTVVRELVRGHGGTIDVASNLGNGTSVTVRLPALSAGTHPTAHKPLTVTHQGDIDQRR